MTRLELLAPARDEAMGIAAVNCGADAVYVGAPRFSARAAAGASVEAIGRLARYAHRYHARVYAALNTILFDDELEEACRIITQLYHAGIDALIIQDMGILEMELPPVPLHASTQVHNATPEKVRFLEKAGFSRVILARELTLEQIAHISKETSVELEAFVHGALCVSV
ncbi:MAG TPA: peptidase U32 family protein, partial [Prolixibacteraceae bacterium]|nr:peptidase U32 family protein [Prolixibacteraceae bacterium]